MHTSCDDVARDFIAFLRHVIYNEDKFVDILVINISFYSEDRRTIKSLFIDSMDFVLTFPLAYDPCSTLY